MRLVDHAVPNMSKKLGFWSFQRKVLYPEAQNAVYLDIYKHNIIHAQSTQVPPTFLPRIPNLISYRMDYTIHKVILPSIRSVSGFISTSFP